VIAVSGKGSERVSIAGLARYRPGERSRLIYRTIVHRGRKNERRSFSERDYIALIDAAHQQLDGPIVLVWDNLNTHVSAAMRHMIDARDWLHVIRLLAYAPDRNPVEAVWSHLNATSATSPSAASTICKPSSKTCSRAPKYRSDLLDGFLAHTGLNIAPETT
jgi:transposase